MKNTAGRINVLTMSHAHSMTVRAALNSFAIDLSNEGLGSDEHGKEMTRLYLERTSELLTAIAKGEKS